jgi:uncharacterized protein
MDYINRILDISLPKGQSAFLWGPRKTGKSTYLKNKYPNSIVYDFLRTDLLFEMVKRPALLREQLAAKSSEELSQPVILDEVQKIPNLLNEVHWLIENRGINFILCGSSARKMKRNQANLLGGRAWRYELFPLTSRELKEISLVNALNRGLVPSHYLFTQYQKSLQAYILDYMKEEVFAEGLTRNISAFSRFFEAMGYAHGELINYTNIARECGVDAKTVKEYYQILIDTLLGRFVLPFKRRQERQVIVKAPKFYLFDVGVAASIIKRHIPEERGEPFGRAFEHFIFMELTAYSSYSDLGYEIRFWRTKTGLEVDFILGDCFAAVEVKGKKQISSRDMRSLKNFCESYKPKRAIIVSNEPEHRVVGGIHIMPWRLFLEQLWEGSVIY